MKALDTNVLARLLLADDAVQFERAKALLSQNEMFTAPSSVMLELVWVLETYELKALEIETALQALLTLPNFQPAHAAELRQALSWYGRGMDFADALHLAMSDASEQMLTFDKSFVKTAQREGLMTNGRNWVAEVT
jgi:predicted nucleic-acid-binding protein